MYKITCRIIFMVLTLCVSSVSAQNKSYTLSGTVKGILNGSVELTAYDYRSRQLTKVNKAVLKDGKFSMTGKLPSAMMARMVISPGNWETQVFLENTKMNIQIDTTAAIGNGSNNASKQLKNVIINGSEGHANYTEFKKTTPVTGAVRSIDNIVKFINSKPSSVFGAYIFEEYYAYNPDMDIAKTEDILSKFTEDAAKSTYTMNVKAEIKERKAVLPGNFADDFTLLTKDSTKVTLSKLNKKYILLDFWASWCKPCRAAIPHWKEVYTQYSPQGLEIISITLDSRRKDWIKAMEEEQMAWPQLTDEYPILGLPGRVFSKYKHRTIPLYILLDKDGKILARTASEKEIDDLLSEKLTNKN